MQFMPDRWARIALTQLLRVADGQWGVVARKQLKNCGLSGTTISRWVAAGRLHRIYPGVYAVGHRAVCREGRLLAAILYAGPGAALSHASAASWWGLLPYLPISVDVCSPVRRRDQPGVNVHGVRLLDRVMHNGLPVTPVARTLLDFASVAPLDRVRKAVAQADYLRLLDLDAIDAVTGVGQSGSARLKHALALHRPQYAYTLSTLEDRLLDLCRRHRICFPEVNVAVLGYKVDALWRNARVVVEVDGGPGHGTTARMRRDHERDLALRAAWFSVLRYSWPQVTERPALVAADLRRALHAAPASVSAAHG